MVSPLQKWSCFNFCILQTQAHWNFWEWQCHLCYLHVYIFLFTPQAKNDCCLRPFWVWIGFLVPFLFARDTLECEKIRERGRENSTAIKTLVLLRGDRPTDRPTDRRRTDCPHSKIQSFSSSTFEVTKVNTTRLNLPESEWHNLEWNLRRNKSSWVQFGIVCHIHVLLLTCRVTETSSNEGDYWENAVPIEF